MLFKSAQKILFNLEPERAHNLTLRSLKLLEPFLMTPEISKPCEAMGIKFSNPVGLAAGFDKNGIAAHSLSKLGFGFVEIGTVTPLPQSGNPKPRLFRLPESNAVINRLGFNNEGVIALANRLKKREFPGVLGINIGKNAKTNNANAIDDYLLCMKEIYPYADYITINISSPNTKNLRDLQKSEILKEFLGTLIEYRNKLMRANNHKVPLVVKLSPDLSTVEIQNIAKTLLQVEIDGVIATNTTTSRDGITDLKYANESGGLSGQPLRNKSTHMINLLDKALKGNITIIGCGGISTPADMYEKFNAGAALIQLYTGLVYHGPQLLRTLLKSL